MIGTRFGILTVTGRATNDKGGSAMWHCRCDCGEVRIVAGTGLRAGRNKSCGCASPRFQLKRDAPPKQSHTRTYRIWTGMLRRCSPESTAKSRRNYFAKGITVCERWQNYANFLADMGEAPDGLSIDRRDGTQNYEPGNCRWATPKEQANNMCRNVRIQYGGGNLTIAQWADLLGIKPNTIVCRLRRGWSPGEALRR